MAQWQASAKWIRENPKCPKATKVWSGCDPTPDEWQHIAAVCQRLTAEMRSLPEPKGETYDGTIGSLIRIYQTNETSPYRELRHHVARHYARLLARLNHNIGGVRVKAITYERLLEWQGRFLGPRDAQTREMAATLMKQLKRVIAFGALVTPHDSGCAEARALFALMAESRRLVRGGGKRTDYITYAQTEAFIRQAHAEGFPSMALAQAFQYDCAMRQKDVIGEWVPTPPEDRIAHGRETWQMGIRWDEISQGLILSHRPSKSIKASTAILQRPDAKPELWDLKVCPLVMAELGRLRVRPLTGPVVICEKTGLPWRSDTFRTVWRRIARKAGIPDEVQNRDARPGAATEAQLAGVATDAVQTTLAHADAAVTERYMRERMEKRAQVQQERMAYRAKSRSVDAE